MNTVETAQSKNISIRVPRLVLVYLLILLWVAGIGARAVYLQVFQAEKYRADAIEQQSSFFDVVSRRGEILDRRLEELAISIGADSLLAAPSKIDNPRQTAELLASVLGQDQHDILRRLTSKRQSVLLARKLDAQQVQAVTRLELSGLSFQKETKRFYPGRELACHLLGFVGVDDEGLSGLEFLHEEELKGHKAKVFIKINGKRQSIERLDDKTLPNGHSLVLNLDKSIQYSAEEILKETIRQTRARDGCVIVMDPNSGDILAMASFPVYDPNRYAGSREEDRRNRAILEIYEPGSTFKIVTMAAVLNENLADLDELVDCRVGTLRLAGKVYREAKRSYGLLTVKQILAKSSNVGTIKLGLRLGDERLYSYIERFGFGAKTGVELPGEQSGLLRPPSQWSQVSIGAMSIGQEIGVTPIQMVRAISAIANGGYLVEPHLVGRTLDDRGELVRQTQAKRVRILNEATAAKMRDGLAMVVAEGTGKAARLTGYSSAGKTGTAQKFIAGQYSHDKYVASYVGFAPLNDPRLAAIVVLNEPEGQYYGGLVAAPAFARIMERALLYLGVPQDEPVPLEQKQTDDPATRVELVRNDAPAEDPEEQPAETLAPDTLEETVLSLIEESPEVTAAPSQVTVRTNSFEVPDFTGWSLRDVAREGARLGLKIRVSGTGVAVAQRPAPGSMVLKETVCEVFFSTDGKKPHGVKKADFEGATKQNKQSRRSHRQS
jgi:cell division protein FtsI/penicillin-binding protein 2